MTNPIARYIDDLDMMGNHPLEFTQLLYLHSEEMDNLIRHADLKAQLILGINAILISANSADLNLSADFRMFFAPVVTSEECLVIVRRW